MKKFLKVLGSLVPLVFFGVIGYFAGVQAGRNSADVVIFPGLLFLYTVIAGILQLAIHEAGHLVFGLLTGYRFLSYRILNLHWQKQKDGRLRFSFHSVPGTLGQCLMIPPSPVDGKIPYVLYNLGGGLANLISVGVWYLTSLTDWVSPEFGNTFALLGLMFAVVNLVPTSSLITNDGANIVSIKKHPKGALFFWSTLAMNAKLAEGVALKDLDDTYFIPIDKEDLTNAMAFGMAVNTVSRMMDKGDFIGARNYLLDLKLTEQKTLEIYTIFAKTLLGYCDLMLDDSTEVSFSKKEWKTVQNLANSQPAFLVFLYAYHMLVEKDEQKAEKHLEKFYKLKKTYHLPVEYISEERNLAILKQKL
ncbi:hypothetical protein ACVRYP_01270 [Streptococcus rifensis]